MQKKEYQEGTERPLNHYTLAQKREMLYKNDWGDGSSGGNSG